MEMTAPRNLVVSVFVLAVLAFPTRALASRNSVPRFDALTRQFYFRGVVDGAVEYQGVDLVHVTSADGIGAWVTAGISPIPGSIYSPDGSYLSAGEWTTRAETLAALKPGTRVRVHAGGAGEPVVTLEGGIDWQRCQSPWCMFASATEATFAQGEHTLSTDFVQTGFAPEWYPWGYLPWHIEVSTRRENPHPGGIPQ